MTEETQYNLIIPFTDGSHSFVHGFECGKIWEQMETGTFIIEPEVALHKCNSDVLKMMAGHFKYQWEFTDHDDVYMFVQFRKGTGLKVIK